MLPYQIRWLTDASRFRIANKARQIRWSTTIGFEAATRAAFKNRKQLLVSSSERTASEILEKCKAWIELANYCGCNLTIDSDSKSELSIAGAGKILSLAQNPDTVRGFSGDVYLDEFAHHSRAKDIYTAILPAITGGFSISAVSTPLGQSGEFYTCWNRPHFTKHKTTIHEAVAEGLPVDVESLRANLDEDSFRQEYLCEFIDESTAYFPYSLILSGVRERPAGSGTVYLGVDVGRKKHLTVIYVLEQLGDTLVTRAIETVRDTEFAAQKKLITHLFHSHNAQRMAIDATGLGMQLAEELKRELGSVELVTFNKEWKEKACIAVKRSFEDKSLQIPDDKELISDIHSIRRTVTTAGNIRFDAESTDIGHADRFWALALAVHTVRQPQVRTRIY